MSWMSEVFYRVSWFSVDSDGCWNPESAEVANYNLALELYKQRCKDSQLVGIDECRHVLIETEKK